MAERVEFAAGNGVTGTGLLGVPPGHEPAGGVLLLHEWWGLNGHIASLIDRLAAAGFVALAPDLYGGKSASSPEEAAALMHAMSWTGSLPVLLGAAEHLRTHARSNGKVGVTGFCMGGGGAFFVAARLPDIAAAVPFYGLAPAEQVDWNTAQTPPIQAHFSIRDSFAPAERAEAVMATLHARGREMELYHYDADHAFVNDTRPEVYDLDCAALAWSRMVAFLHAYVD